MSTGHKIHDTSAVYFRTFQVVDWDDVSQRNHSEEEGLLQIVVTDS